MYDKFLDQLKKWFPHLFKIQPRGTNCFVALGLPGCGKSMRQIIEYVLPCILNDEEIWSNTWLNIDNDKIHYFWKFEEVENLRNTTIFIDEIGQFLPARDWANEGMRVQMWFQLHRHRHLDIIANTQHVSLVAKTVGIVANSWAYMTKGGNPIMNFIYLLFNKENVAIDIYELSWQKLKKIEAGMEIGDFSDDQLAGLHRTERYFIEEIIRPDLDDRKLELVKRYCPMCAIRTGEMIPRNETLTYCNLDAVTGKYSLKEIEQCPKCHTQLEIRVSGIYDTDHEPPLNDEGEKIFWQPMIPSPEGYTNIKYSGGVPKRKLDELAQLKSQRYKK